MKETFEITQHAFFIFGEWVSMILEIVSVLIIVFGLINVVYYRFTRGEKPLTPFRHRIRIKFGGYLILALEILLASDIIQTTISPTYENLIKVGAIALIRTFLNYFLGRELKEETEEVKKHSETIKKK